MSLVHVIRYKVLVEGLGVRATARECGVSRNTVRKYLKESEPLVHHRVHRRSPVLERVAPRIDAIVDAWKDRVTEKQRITAARVHRELREDGQEVGLTTVRSYLAEKRRQSREVYVPLEYRLAEVVEIDFFEVTVDVGAERRRVWKFLMRLMYSGAEFTWLYDHANQLSFLDGHVRAFAYFGGVPHRGIYDNLSSAVKRRVGIDRELTERFLALCSHYLFEPCFARPGEGHDKGGVESAGKSIRLQHLTPIPRAESLPEISTALLERLETARITTKDGTGRTVAERFAEERCGLRALPERPFDARLTLPVIVSSMALVSVEGAQYSVPSEWVGLSALAHVGVSDIELVCRAQRFTVAKVPRGQRVVQYLHYRKELARKPNAVRQVAPALLVELGEPYGELWRRIERSYGPKDAARVLSRLLGVSDQPDALHLIERLAAELPSGEAGPVARPPAPPTVVVPETLADYVVEAGQAADYDRLLAEAANG